MASPNTFLSLLFLSLLCLFSTISSQTINGNSPSIPTTIGSCGPSLLPLASCAPFVQGAIPSPPQPCCDNLKQIYQQQPKCLCLLLNDTNLRSLPINTTLALQLPVFCSLQVDIATCSGVPLPPSSPASQVSFGSENNSTVSGTPPMVTVSPRPSIMGFGFRPSAAIKLNADYQFSLMMLLAAIILMLTIFC